MKISERDCCARVGVGLKLCDETGKRTTPTLAQTKVIVDIGKYRECAPSAKLPGSGGGPEACA